MHHAIATCGCSTEDCWTMPAEFVRVRYFYGQRLGVMELGDEASYHAGKHAFHNARLHGAGVLCGLRAERVPFQGGATTTVLTVRRGAALDNCGREIVVGVDQCIDLRAWFEKNKMRPELAAWTANTTQRLTVALRYRECPTDPSPAPRDPCGCDNGGCEFGRIREGFELALLTDGEAAAQCKDVSFPATASLLAALDSLAPAASAGATGGAAHAAIAPLVAADCPEAVEDFWLCLASFDVPLDATPVPADITTLNNAILSRRSLLSTSALQSVALSLALAGADAGLLGGGPRVSRLEYAAIGPASGTLALPIVLAKTGSPPVDAPIVAATFDPVTVKVRRLDPAAGWVDLTPPVADITFQAGPAPRIAIRIGAGLTAGSRFLVVIETGPSRPITDTVGRPLRPQPFARQFAFVPDGANLKLDPLV
jgi:hypothetical protein